MRVRHSLALLLFVSTYVSAGDPDISESFISPGGKYIIGFKGAYRGQGAYYLQTESGDLQIIKREVYYGPQLRWVTPTIAEVKFGCGSPCWENYYFDAYERRLSPLFPMALAINPQSKLVAAVEEKGVTVRHMLTGALVAMQEMDTGVWAGLLTFCDPEFQFKGDDEFQYAYACGELTFGPYGPGNGVQTIFLKQKQRHNHLNQPASWPANLLP